jgi:hypothetical protein
LQSDSARFSVPNPSQLVAASVRILLFATFYVSVVLLRSPLFRHSSSLCNSHPNPGSVVKKTFHSHVLLNSARTSKVALAKK